MRIETGLRNEGVKQNPKWLLGEINRVLVKHASSLAIAHLRDNALMLLRVKLVQLVA